MILLINQWSLVLAPSFYLRSWPLEESVPTTTWNRRHRRARTASRRLRCRGTGRRTTSTCRPWQRTAITMAMWAVALTRPAITTICGWCPDTVRIWGNGKRRRVWSFGGVPSSVIGMMMMECGLQSQVVGYSVQSSVYFFLCHLCLWLITIPLWIPLKCAFDQWRPAVATWTATPATAGPGDVVTATAWVLCHDLLATNQGIGSAHPASALQPCAKVKGRPPPTEWLSSLLEPDWNILCLMEEWDYLIIFTFPLFSLLIFTCYVRLLPPDTGQFMVDDRNCI